jgi:hypothetical protein
MPPTHTLTTRPATPDERRVIERQIRTDVPSYGCITIMFGVVPPVLLAAAGGWVAGHVSPGHVGLARARSARSRAWASFSACC